MGVCVNESGGVLDGFWDLPSGRWAKAQGAALASYFLTATREGHALPPALDPQDALRLVGARQREGRTFPPEFGFDPDDGHVLPAPTTGARSTWLPPFGDGGDDAVRGLRRTPTALTLPTSGTYTESDDPERTLPLPPPGRHEFFVLPSVSGSKELLALDAEQGALHLWLPAAGRWAALEQLDGGLLADSPLPHEAWRCEFANDASGGLHLFLPTSNGVACLQLDWLRLGYHVGYVGDGACCGAPILWRDEIWAVLRDAQGGVRLQATTAASGLAGGTLKVADVVAGERFAAPVCVRRQVIWPGMHGRLVLEVQANGSLAAHYRPWPEGMSPKFDFGAPYLAREGQLWQACWSEHDESHAYLRLDGRDMEQRLASAPRLCTGQINYRLAARMKLPPWADPEHGSDADSRALFIPMLESAVDAGVLGVRIDTTDGLEATIGSGERVRAVVELHSDHRLETRLYTLNVPAPWQGRAFVHDDTLWFYHPELKSVAGWELEQ
ncbi:conserved hypothetical protein [uncultured Stenotrophomonas sp.]|uniref:Uncharacterized protein n=1 Tax=uncultured Stenotrophomonas sp. TaxID=165438 RepID=A0A1Y5Q3A1_9GAMM|nr:conserved hypothetical protein [uncultured Stenotrophomonas sp.]